MYKQISHQEFSVLKENQELLIADVRDQESYEMSHIPGALHLSMEILQEFCSNAERSRPIVIYCYHGVTSQSVAQLLVDEGFEEVYSLEGGYHSWFGVQDA